jgi:hypothetical protein
MPRPSWIRGPTPGPTQVADTIIIAMLLFGFLAGTLLIAAGAFGRGNGAPKVIRYVPIVKREQRLDERALNRAPRVRSLTRYQLQRTHGETGYGTMT